MTYTQVTSKRTEEKKCCERLFIKVRNPANFIEKIKKDINPTKVNAMINIVKKIKEDTVLVVSPAAADIQNYKAAVQEKFDKEVKIIEEKKRNPEIVIFDIGSHDKEEVELAITNETEEKPLSCRIVKTHSGKTRAYVSLKPESLKKLESRNNERLHLGYTRCRFERHISVLRCYKCLSFGHKAADCKKTR